MNKTVRSIKQRRRSNNKKKAKRSIKQRRSNKRHDGVVPNPNDPNDDPNVPNDDPNDPGKVVPNLANDPVKVVPNPDNDPVKVVPNPDDEKLIKSMLKEQEEYSKYLLTHYINGFKDCKSNNLEKIEKYLDVLSEKFDEWKKNKCEFFGLLSHKMNFNFKARYTVRKCNGEKHNRIALNIMRIGFFNTDYYLKNLMNTMFGDDETSNKKIIKEFKQIDEFRFDMECNIFIRVINLFMEKLDIGQVLYLENVFNSCWQQVLESMKFQTCNNGNDYYLIKSKS